MKPSGKKCCSTATERVKHPVSDTCPLQHVKRKPQRKHCEIGTYGIQPQKSGCGWWKILKRLKGAKPPWGGYLKNCKGLFEIQTLLSFLSSSFGQRRSSSLKATPLRDHFTRRKTCFHPPNQHNILRRWRPHTAAWHHPKLLWEILAKSQRSLIHASLPPSGCLGPRLPVNPIPAHVSKGFFTTNQSIPP